MSLGKKPLDHWLSICNTYLEINYILCRFTFSVGFWSLIVFGCLVADGQAIALRLSKQINGCNIRLKKNIAAYNCLQWPPQVASFPFRLEFQEACDVSFAGYLCLDENVSAFLIWFPNYEHFALTN